MNVVESVSSERNKQPLFITRKSRPPTPQEREALFKTVSTVVVKNLEAGRNFFYSTQLSHAANVIEKEGRTLGERDFLGKSLRARVAANLREEALHHKNLARGIHLTLPREFRSDLRGVIRAPAQPWVLEAAGKMARIMQKHGTSTLRR